MKQKNFLVHTITKRYKCPTCGEELLFSEDSYFNENDEEYLDNSYYYCRGFGCRVVNLDEIDIVAELIKEEEDTVEVPLSDVINMLLQDNNFIYQMKQRVFHGTGLLE